MITYVAVGAVSFAIGTIFGIMCAALCNAGKSYSDDSGQENLSGCNKDS